MMLILVSILCMVSAQDYIESNIHNGHSALIEHFPFQVLVYSYQGDCGGALISNRFVITAAHCVITVPAIFITAHMGSIYQFEKTGRVVWRYTVHPDFNETYLWNDIALLDIVYVNYSSSVNAIALPDISDSNYNYESETALISGWGRIDYDYEMSPILLYAEVFVISNDDCDNIFGGGIIVDTNICTMGLNKEAICVGDSGGPLVHKDSGILIGIASFGPKGNCSYASSFTRISKYRQWIQDYTGI